MKIEPSPPPRAVVLLLGRQRCVRRQPDYNTRRLIGDASTETQLQAAAAEEEEGGGRSRRRAGSLLLLSPADAFADEGLVVCSSSLSRESREEPGGPPLSSARLEKRSRPPP
jgi:hypothetical protein